MANRHFSREEKQRAVERMTKCNHTKLAAELGVAKIYLYRWRKELRGERAKPSKQQQLEQENQQLRSVLATKVLEADFLQGVLRRIEARRQSSKGSGETASTNKCGS